MRVNALAVLLGICFAMGVASSGCGTQAVGVESCRRVEEARCHQASACKVDLTRPAGGAGGDVESCVRYYETACLHGLVAADPGNAAVDACVAAVNKGACNVVLHPESSPACAWLVPPPPAPAAADASAPDAGRDAS